MTDYSIIELELCETIGLARRPVTVTFLSRPPQGVPKFAGEAPSGCSFFSIAAGGMTFYTVPDQHYRCPVGSYSYNLSLPPGHRKELERSLASFRKSGAVRMGEIRSVPRTKKHPEVVIYSPLGDTPVEPDITVLVVRPLQAMMLQEAAMRRRIALQIAPFARPTCMSLHEVLNEKAVTSAGCLGNRVYNGLGDDDFYMLIPGQFLQKISEEIQTIATANTKLSEYYLEQRGSVESMLE